MADMAQRQKTVRPKETANDGTQEKVLAQVQHSLDNPFARFPVKVDPSQKLTPMKMYEDGGRKVAILATLGQRAATQRFPKTAEGVFTSLEDMLRFCMEYQLAPTLGIFAIWNGVTMQRVWQIENGDDERARAVSVCKETIRSIIEQSAIEGTFNPLLFFNAMKSQYGLAENVTVTHRTEDNAREITEDEYNERVIQLTQGEDGVYR
jgi:hypothetical protein